MNSFESAVFSALKGLSRGVILLAAVSGGADSTAMLAALAALRGHMDFVPRVLHVDHGMRPVPETRGDAAAVRELARRFGVPCRVVHIPPGRIERAGPAWGIGPEAAARFFRMRILRREARRINAAAILVAHTRDDALENTLMRFLRGAGPSGLAAMPVARGLILRPLLQTTRAEVLAYLAEKNIVFRSDSTNNEIRYLRNRVRHRLIPVLDEFFPFWRNSLPGLAETQSKAARFIADEAARRVIWNGVSGALRAELQPFLAEPPIIREEAVFLAADRILSKAGKTPDKKNFSVPRRASLRCFLDGSAGPNKAADLGPVSLEMKDGDIRVTRAIRGGFDYDFVMVIDAPGDYRLKKKFSVRVEVCAGSFDETAGPPRRAGVTENPKNAAFSGEFFAELPLVFKPWKSGDRIVKAGHERRLSDIVGKEARSEGVFLTARDRQGVAAFIKTGLPTGSSVREPDNAVLCRRDGPSRSTECIFYVTSCFTGGIDA